MKPRPDTRRDTHGRQPAERTAPRRAGIGLRLRGGYCKTHDPRIPLGGAQSIYNSGRWLVCSELCPPTCTSVLIVSSVAHAPSVLRVGRRASALCSGASYLLACCFIVKRHARMSPARTLGKAFCFLASQRATKSLRCRERVSTVRRQLQSLQPSRLHDRTIYIGRTI
eukprot:7391463-Prymnesium_polylepis.2